MKTKDKIRDAATRLLLEKGGGGLTIREIAAEAGVNKGLLHHYFGSKENLMIDVIEHKGDQIKKMIQQYLESQPDPVKRPPVELMLNSDFGPFLIEVINLTQRMPGVKKKAKEIITSRRNYFGALFGIEGEQNRVIMESFILGFIMLSFVDSSLETEDIVNHFFDNILDKSS
ncbi:TetR/AcrR family transcriptional regulator [bacterium]|nr:TetR/AcrR family transcriptional regulator [bacterium]